MQGCLSILFIIILLGLLINFPLLAIGLGVTIWGIYEWKINKKLNAKSMMPAIIVIFGVIIIFASPIFSNDNDSSKQVTETAISSKIENEKSEKNEDQNKDSQSTDQKSNEVVDKNTDQQLEEENRQEEQEQAKQEEVNKQNETASTLGLVAATVARVVDGDTIELTDGRKVRLIGVNTPESTTRTEEYGKEASDYTKSKLNGRKIWLQKDVSETDRYGRLLRLVWLEVPTNLMDEKEIRSKMFNANLVINGYAEPSTYPPDVTYAEFFRKFAREAREKGIGLWAYGPEGTTKGDFDSGSSSSTSRNNSNTSNNSNNSSGSTSSSSSSGNEYFANCTELRKVYPDGVPEGHPAYQAKMDRDKDGWACER